MSAFAAGETVLHIDGSEGLILSWNAEKNFGMVQFGANTEAIPCDPSVLVFAHQHLAVLAKSIGNQTIVVHYDPDGVFIGCHSPLDDTRRILCSICHSGVKVLVVG